MKTKFRFLTNLALIMWFLCMLSVVTAGSMDYERQAERILVATDVKGGLIVHVGCGAGELTAAMGGYLFFARRRRLGWLDNLSLRIGQFRIDIGEPKG